MPSQVDEATVLGYLDTLSNWGRWGLDDERGTLNHIAPEHRRIAATLVTQGITVSCAREIGTVAAPGDQFGAPLRLMVSSGQGLGDAHRVQQPRPGPPGSDRFHGASEYIGMVFHGWSVSHLDALSHQFADRRMYNGVPAELVTAHAGATRNAVTAAADGVVTRGVLLDIAALHGRDWLEPSTPIHIADLEAAEARQGVRVGQGDVLLVRTGYGRRRREHGQADPWREGRAGLHAACLPWLQERAIAMLGSDTANDVMPSGYPQLRMPIHIVGMVAIGLWLMDNLDLEDLAATSAELTRREFLFMLAPLRFAGGTGSPVNPLAVF